MTGDMDPKTNFALIVIQTELERFKYLMRSFLRARIAKVSDHKPLTVLEVATSSLPPGLQGTYSARLCLTALQIDRHTLHYLSTPELRARLSQMELAYATRHQALLHNHYLSSFLGSFPPALQNLNDTSGNISMIDTPDLDSAVFIRILQDTVVEGHGTDEDGGMNGSIGDIAIIRWSDAKSLVETGSAELV